MTFDAFKEALFYETIAQGYAARDSRIENLHAADCEDYTTVDFDVFTKTGKQAVYHISLPCYHLAPRFYWDRASVDCLKSDGFMKNYKAHAFDLNVEFNIAQRVINDANERINAVLPEAIANGATAEELRSIAYDAGIARIERGLAKAAGRYYEEALSLLTADLDRYASMAAPAAVEVEETTETVETAAAAAAESTATVTRSITAVASAIFDIFVEGVLTVAIWESKGDFSYAILGDTYENDGEDWAESSSQDVARLQKLLDIDPHTLVLNGYTDIPFISEESGSVCELAEFIAREHGSATTPTYTFMVDGQTVTVGARAPTGSAGREREKVRRVVDQASFRVNRATVKCIERIYRDIERGRPYDIGRCMAKYKVLRDLSPADHHEVWNMIHSLLPATI